MDNIALWSRTDRRDLFTETGNRRGVAPAIIEKDFWVCWTLKHIFELPVAPHLLFKGGTSLSKVFGVIGRFSEDIDLSIHRDYLGFGGENEPERLFSKTKRKEAIEKLLPNACIANIHDEFLPSLRMSITAVLIESEPWRLGLDPADPQTIYFTYPEGLDPAGLLSYIPSVVKLEMGARSDPYPSGTHRVKSYAAEEFPELFEDGSCSVNALEAERTFWEKATILHAEYHRPDGRGAPDRISRHYSDLAQLGGTTIADNAIANVSLLERVSTYKSVYFASKWANYDEAKPGSLRLLPSAKREAALRRDYERMQGMFFGSRLTFEQVLSALQDLEIRINEKATV